MSSVPPAARRRRGRPRLVLTEDEILARKIKVTENNRLAARKSRAKKKKVMTVAEKMSEDDRVPEEYRASLGPLVHSGNTPPPYHFPGGSVSPHAPSSNMMVFPQPHMQVRSHHHHHHLSHQAPSQANHLRSQTVMYGNQVPHAPLHGAPSFWAHAHAQQQLPLPGVYDPNVVLNNVDSMSEAPLHGAPSFWANAQHQLPLPGVHDPNVVLNNVDSMYYHMPQPNVMMPPHHQLSSQPQALPLLPAEAYQHVQFAAPAPAPAMVSAPFQGPYDYQAPTSFGMSNFNYGVPVADPSLAAAAEQSDLNALQLASEQERILPEFLLQAAADCGYSVVGQQGEPSGFVPVTGQQEDSMGYQPQPVVETAPEQHEQPASLPPIAEQQTDALPVIDVDNLDNINFSDQEWAEVMKEIPFPKLWWES